MKKLTAEFKALGSKVNSDRKAYDAFTQSVIRLCTKFKEDLVHLNKLSQGLRSDVDSFGSSQSIGQNPNVMNMADLNDNYKDLNSRLNQINEVVKSFRQPESVNFGNLTFATKDDLKVWVLDNTEDGEDGSFPFGGFLDVSSFLARIQTDGE